MGRDHNNYDVHLCLIGPSAPPGQVKVKDVGKRNATIKWNNPRMEHQNGIIRNFIIYVTPREDWLESTKYTTPSPQLQYTINDLHPFCIYTVTVTAVTTVAGPNSTDVDIQTMEDSSYVYQLIKLQLLHYYFVLLQFH